MQELPICAKCGQDEEYLVSDTGEYVCICGHQFEGLELDASEKETNLSTGRVVKTNAFQATYQHRSTSLLH